MVAPVLAVALVAAAISPELGNTSWRLARVDGEAVTRGRLDDLSFGPGVQMHGADGCNGFWGTYTIWDGKLEVSPEGETTVSCRDKPHFNHIRLGARFKQILLDQPHVLRRGRTLHLVGADGRTADLALAPAQGQHGR